MFPKIYEDYIYVYEKSVVIEEGMEDVIRRGTASDWSFVSFTTVVPESADVALSEIASLNPLSTQVDDVFLNYLREKITSIDFISLENFQDYCLSHDISAKQFSSYDMIRISSTSNNGFSAIVGGLLQDGIISEVVSISPNDTKLDFPHLGIEVPISQGDTVFIPGGFPYSFRCLANPSNIFLKRSCR